MPNIVLTAGRHGGRSGCQSGYSGSNMGNCASIADQAAAGMNVSGATGSVSACEAGRIKLQALTYARREKKRENPCRQRPRSSSDAQSTGPGTGDTRAEVSSLLGRGQRCGESRGHSAELTRGGQSTSAKSFTQRRRSPERGEAGNGSASTARTRTGRTDNDVSKEPTVTRPRQVGPGRRSTCRTRADVSEQGRGVSIEVQASARRRGRAELRHDWPASPRRSWPLRRASPVRPRSPSRR